MPREKYYRDHSERMYGGNSSGIWHQIYVSLFLSSITFEIKTSQIESWNIHKRPYVLTIHFSYALKKYLLKIVAT